MAQRRYWPKLKIVVKIAVKYYLRYQAKLPSELRTAGDTVMLAAQAFLVILELYDAAHAGGEPQDNITEGF